MSTQPSEDVERSIKNWLAEGYDVLGIRGDGSTYPTRTADTPNPGGMSLTIDRYVALDSDDAAEALRAEAKRCGFCMDFPCRCAENAHHAMTGE